MQPVRFRHNASVEPALSRGACIVHDCCQVCFGCKHKNFSIKVNSKRTLNRVNDNNWNITLTCGKVYISWCKIQSFELLCLLFYPFLQAKESNEIVPQARFLILSTSYQCIKSLRTVSLSWRQFCKLCRRTNIHNTQTPTTPNTYTPHSQPI